MDLCGSWLLESSKNFPDFLHGCGVNKLIAKLAATLAPTETISVVNDQWTIKTSTKIKTSSLTFRLNESFDEVTMDYRKVRTVVTLEVETIGDERVTKLSQVQKNGSGDTIYIIRSVKVKGEQIRAGDVMEVQMKVKDKEAFAIFRRI